MTRLLTLAEVAAWLQLPPKTLYEMRYRRTGPPAFRVGRWLRYDERAVQRWLDERQEHDPATPVLPPGLSAATGKHDMAA